MNIKLQNSLPNGKFRDRLSGVYKITFDNGYFYIGASGHIRSRFVTWSASLSGKKNDKRHIWESMKSKVKNCEYAVFEILEEANKDRLIECEEKHLFIYKEHPNLINQFLYVKIPILQYTKEMNFIRRFDSIVSASKFFNVPHSRIRDVVSGRRKSWYGYIFITETPNAVKKHIKKSKQNKIKVFRFNEHNEYIDSFDTLTEAARSSKINRRGIYSVLKGQQKTAGGYIFKTAI